MKANELRIGNLVKRESQPDGFYIDSQSFLKVELHPNWYEPIPLTEDWLIKFGFLKSNDGSNDYISECYSGDFIITFNTYPFCCDIDTAGYADFPSKSKLSIRLQYVHQLQNLYFALTGEELTIN